MIEIDQNAPVGVTYEVGDSDRELEEPRGLFVQPYEEEDYLFFTAIPRNIDERWVFATDGAKVVRIGPRTIGSERPEFTRLKGYVVFNGDNGLLGMEPRRVKLSKLQEAFE